MNQYKPWVELGISELEYWKMRFIEAEKLLCKYEKLGEEYEQLLKSWMKSYDELKEKYEPLIASVGDI